MSYVPVHQECQRERERERESGRERERGGGEREREIEIEYGREWTGTSSRIDSAVFAGKSRVVMI